MAKVGTGALLTFGTSTSSFSIISIDGPSGRSRPSIPTSHLRTTNDDTFIPGNLADPGELEFEYLYDPLTASGNAVDMNDPAETLTVVWASTGTATVGGKWSASGFVTGHTINTPMEDRITATVTYKLSGAVTFTDAT